MTKQKKVFVVFEKNEALATDFGKIRGIFSKFKDAKARKQDIFNQEKKDFEITIEIYFVG